MPKRNLREHVIVITGASSGIGWATAVACAKAGMDVVISGRNKAKLDLLSTLIASTGRQALPIVCDVRKDEDVLRLVQQTVETFGRLDVMFANAGYGLYADVVSTTDQQMRDIFETNFFGTVRCIREAVPIMRRLGGLKHIVICSSSVSEIGLPMNGAYCATKAAQDSIAGALRAELADEGILVSSVHPIGTKSDFFNRTSILADGLDVPTGTPPKMMQTPDYVANKIVACLEKPKAEVWPHWPTRLGLAIVTAFPSLGASSMVKMMRKMPQPGDHRSE